MILKDVAVYDEKRNRTVVYNTFLDRFSFKPGYDEDLCGLRFGLIPSKDGCSDGDRTHFKLKEYLNELTPDFNKLTDLKIFATTSCNISCKYCIVKKFGALKSDKEVECLIPSVEYLDEFIGRNSTINYILFSGGEPLLVFDKIREICDRYPKFTVRINTNALLLTEEMVEYIVNRGNMQISISLDILDKNNDWRTNRELNPTQYRVRELLREYIEKYPKFCDFVNINSLIQPGTEIDFDELMDFIKELGINNHSIIVPQHAANIDEDFNNNGVLRQIHDWMISDFKVQWNLGSIFLPSLLYNHYKGGGDNFLKSSWKTKIAFMDVDGEVSRCPLIYLNSDGSDKEEFFYGSYDKPIDVEKYRGILLKTFDRCSELYCRKCPIRFFCNMYADAYSVVCTSSVESLDLYCGYNIMAFAYNIFKNLEILGEKYYDYLDHYNKEMDEYYVRQ